MAPSSKAKVFSLPVRTEAPSAPVEAPELPTPDGARFGAIDDMLIVIGDMELDAFAQLFSISPLRHAMTFEAYLATKGFARMVPKRTPSS